MRFSFITAAFAFFCGALFAQTLPVIHETSFGIPGSSSFFDGTYPLDDLTQDGVPDFAVRTRTPGPNVFIRLELISGSDGAVVQQIYPSDGSTMGRAEAQPMTLGDMNGDGIPEIALSAPTFGVAITTFAPPAVRLQDGATGQVLWTTPVSPGTNDLEEIGPPVPAGDLDGDGVTDLVVLLEGASVLPLLGSSTPSRLRWLSGATGALLHEIVDDARLIERVINVGDANADGINDFAVAAPGASLNALNAGAVSLISGADFSYLQFWVGTMPSDRFGSGIAAAGDVDQDGCADVMIAAQGRDKVFVFSGQPAALLQSFDLNLGGLSFVRLESPIRSFDWNGDGIEDRWFTGFQTFTIRSGVDMSVLFSTFDTTRRLVGDVNGDGIVDLASSEPSLTNPRLMVVTAHKGAEAYGTGSGPIGLSWQPSSLVPANGTLAATGGNPSSSGVLAVSTNRSFGQIPGSTLPLFVSLAPTALLLLEPIALDAQGSWSTTLSLTQPALADTSLFFQWASLSGTSQSSNGLQLLFSQ